ncbi:acyl-CoA desaturase [Actinopolymorpha sp. NPDC004070]|uniref:fatty acid desaturase family protein n=1 Tax=Actinopolymorpha sp. NPDC004070 TaxID=3154548 RepID=UPI0033A028AE
MSTDIAFERDDAATARASRNPNPGSEFAELRRRVSEAGLFARRPGYYAARTAVVTACYAGAWVVFGLLGDTWAQLLVAAFLGVVFAQVALVAHDLAHRQIFRTRRPSEFAGLIAGNLGIGMSYGWWMDKHTRHHANPNHEDLDPDVGPGILVWSAEQARASRGVTRMIGRRQTFWFFPLLTLEGFNLHVSAVRALARPGLRTRRWEAVLLTAHTVAYVAALFLTLSPGLAFAFCLVHQAVFGLYLGSTFAPNHKGMPAPTPEQQKDFLRRQVLTSRNVRGGRLVDVALGGLNYQIEHHLFPSMPSPHLRRAQPIVRAYCAERGIAYQEPGLVDSYAQALRHLHSVGAPLRAGRRQS